MIMPSLSPNLDNVVIRSASRQEAERAYRLFNIQLLLDNQLLLFVALQTTPATRLVGYVAMSVQNTKDLQPVRAKLTWGVLSGYVTTQLSLRLLAKAASAASDLGMILETVKFFPKDAPETNILQAAGYIPVEMLNEYEVAYHEVWQRIDRIYVTLKKRRLMPDTAVIGGLKNADIPFLRNQFHQEGILDVADFDARLSGRHPEPFDLPNSTVVALNGNIIGAILVAPLPSSTVPRKRGYIVLARWVAPIYRQGWVNAVLIHRSVGNGLEYHLDYVRFLANTSNHQETARLSQRLGGLLVGCRQRYIQPIKEAI